ncbi:MAG: type 1 glutamine amidotransferase [Chloroflexi bacterium]|nr:type 1 glutamine amidotransferase [Chloroflexota bacterium]
MKRALIIRHAAPETLGSNYNEVLNQAGFNLVPVDLFDLAPDYASFPAPPLAEVSLVVALGGPLSANDDYPALKSEMDYLKGATAQGIPVFGVCLGAQLLSRALGGRVEPTGGYQFGLRRLSITAAGDADPVFGKLRVPLVPTLHGECFSVPPEAASLAEGYILLRDGGYRRIDMAFRQGNSYGFQFEPQLTFDELEIWNRELAGDYLLMGDRFDPQEEAARNLREFARFAPVHEKQMRGMLWAFLETTGLLDGAKPSDLERRSP